MLFYINNRYIIDNSKRFTLLRDLIYTIHYNISIHNNYYHIYNIILLCIPEYFFSNYHSYI